jgi:PAS domain S-box-containing protein
MNKISQSTLLKAILPFGACIGFDGTVHFFSDESDITGFKKTVPDNASQLFDSTIFNEIKNIAQKMSACGQDMFRIPVTIGKAECYLNIKSLPDLEKNEQLILLEFIPLSNNGIFKNHEILLRSVTSVNLSVYVDALNIPFALFFILRDSEGVPSDLAFISVNNAYCELSGKVASDIVNKKYSDVFGDVDSDFVSVLGEISLNNEATKLFDFEKRLQKYVEINAVSTVKDIVGCLFFDITDLIITNKQLRTEEEYVRTLINVNPDIIFVFDKKGLFLDCHVNDESELFRKREDLIRKSALQVMSSEVGKLTMMHIESVLKNNHLEEYQYELMFDNDVRYHEARMVPYGNDKVVCIIRNITHRVMAEAELEMRRSEIIANNKFLTEVMDGIAFPLWVVDVNEKGLMHIRDINDTYQKIFKIKREEIVGLELKELRKFYSNDYYNNVISFYDECAMTQKPVIHERVFFDMTVGEKFYFLATLMPQIDEKGKLRRIIGSATDISGLKRTQERLTEAMEKATEADRLKSSFLANMSHEIRTPLNSITGFSELIQDEDVTPQERAEMCRIIEKNSSQLLKLVNNIIEISKIESEQLKLVYRDFDINRLLDELVQEMEIEMYRKKKVLELKPVKTIPVRAFFCTDEFRVKQILEHLLDNALKFSKEGAIEFGYQQNSKEELQFYVKDQGIGIPKDKQTTIFELFRQLDDSSTRKYGGTGMGLSISSKMVKALGGKLWVESEPGEGTTFFFTVKRNDATPVFEE